MSSTAAILETIRPLFGDELDAVELEIDRLLENDVTLIPEVAKHVILSGGKRLRPILTLLSSRLSGYIGDRQIRLAVCVEFIHTATLLHDDVVDKSDLRRGSKTANNLWGNEASILVGDFLLSRAFQLMVGDGSLKVLKLLSDTSAIISEGEVLQLTHENNIENDLPTYLKIISAKTAQLFAAACQIGAALAEREEHEKPLFDFGHNLGLAFQIADDALDYSARREKLGKSIGGDFRESKATLPVILAWRKSNAEEKKFWIRTVREKNQWQGDLARAISIMEKYRILQEAIDYAKKYVEKARGSLEIFKNSPEKDALLELLDFSVSREY